ncbi:MAG: radical SAM protein [Lachnospiraceae bacterium]|nr:radical SAM protein [Lachnospiraceae bacterium]
MECRICPRRCGVDREKGNIGYCGADEKIRVARAALHYWEEPCISGDEGSGTVFFSGCNLHCVYCQNYKISGGETGKVISIEELAEIFLRLQAKGANNINLVTPTHYVLPIRAALQMAKARGLIIPIAYNCGGYESVTALKALAGYVDIYLTDFKYVSTVLAEKYSSAEDYFEVAAAALQEMVRQVGNAVFVPGDGAAQKDGLMKKGVIVRHLLLPGQIDDSKRVLSYLHQTYGERIFISIMNQYTPLPHVAKWPELNRKVTDEEYEEVIDYAIEIGIENGFIQEGETAEESFIPDFGTDMILEL